MRHQRSDYSLPASCQSNQPLPSHNFLGQCTTFENQPTNTNLASIQSLILELNVAFLCMFHCVQAHVFILMKMKILVALYHVVRLVCVISEYVKIVISGNLRRQINVHQFWIVKILHIPDICSCFSVKSEKIYYLNMASNFACVAGSY